MVSNIPGMDLAALSAYAKEHNMSYGQLVASLNKEEERQIIEDYESKREERRAARHLARVRANQMDWDRAYAMELWRDGKTDMEIASIVDCTVDEFRSWRCRQHLKPNHRQLEQEAKEKQEAKPEKRDRDQKGRPSDAQDKIHYETAIMMYEEGCADTKIAERFGVSLGTVKAWRKNHGLKSAYQLRKEARIKRIKDLLAKGATVQEISRKTYRTVQETKTFCRANGIELNETKK